MPNESRRAADIIADELLHVPVGTFGDPSLIVLKPEVGPVPLTVPENLGDAYRVDLAVWQQMVERWAPHPPFDWRDEQSFKRGWMASRLRLVAELTPLVQRAWAATGEDDPDAADIDALVDALRSLRELTRSDADRG